MDRPSLPLQPFGIAWAFSIAIHLANFPHFLGTVAGNAYALAGCFLILKPSCAHRLALAVLFEAIAIYDHMPLVANHLYFVFIFDLTILCSYLFHRKTADLPSKLLQGAFPAVLLAQVFLYLVAALHKLNSDYFVPEVSSAIYLYQRIAGDIPLPPLNSFGEAFVIYSSIGIELLIPALLLFQKTRPLAIAIGMSFHLFLSCEVFFGQRGLAAFSITMFSIFIFYEPHRWQAIFDITAKSIRKIHLGPLQPIQKIPPLGALTFTVAFLVIYDLSTNDRSGHSFLLRSGHIFWILLGTSYLLAYLASFIFSKKQLPAAFPPLHRSLRQPIVILPSLVIIFLGLCPYLGLGTKGTFSMFSNLRVETEKTNHFLIPASWRIFAHNQELVQVESSSHLRLQDYAENQLFINPFEIRRLAQSSDKNFWLTIREGEVSKLISHTGTPEHPYLQPLHPLAEKVFRFRPVEPQHRPAKSRH